MLNIAGYHHNVAGSAGVRKAQEAPHPTLPPTEFCEGKKVTIVMRSVIEKKRHAVEVVEIDPAFFTTMKKLDDASVKYLKWVLSLSALGLSATGLAGVVLSAIYLGTECYLGILATVLICVCGGYSAVLFAVVCQESAQREINALCERYGVDLSAGAIYEGPETLGYADLVYVPKW